MEGFFFIFFFLTFTLKQKQKQKKKERNFLNFLKECGNLFLKALNFLSLTVK